MALKEQDGTPSCIHRMNTSFPIWRNSDPWFGIFGSRNTIGSMHGESYNEPVKVQGNAVGQATMASGNTSVTVNTPAATLNSIILLTPLGESAHPLCVTPAPGSFTIQTTMFPINDLNIAYLIIN